MKKKEQEQLNTLFQVRKDYNNWQTQDELQKQTLQRMNDRIQFLKDTQKKNNSPKN